MKSFLVDFNDNFWKYIVVIVLIIMLSFSIKWTNCLCSFSEAAVRFFDRNGPNENFTVEHALFGDAINDARSKEGNLSNEMNSEAEDIQRKAMEEVNTAKKEAMDEAAKKVKEATDEANSKIAEVKKKQAVANAKANEANAKAKLEIAENSPSSIFNNIENKAKNLQETAENKAKNFQETAENKAKNFQETAENKAKNLQETAENKAKSFQETAENKAKNLQETAENKANSIKNKTTFSISNKIADEKKKLAEDEALLESFTSKVRTCEIKSPNNIVAGYMNSIDHDINNTCNHPNPNDCSLVKSSATGGVQYIEARSLRKSHGEFSGVTEWTKQTE